MGPPESVIASRVGLLEGSTVTIENFNDDSEGGEIDEVEQEEEGIATQPSQGDQANGRTILTASASTSASASDRPMQSSRGQAAPVTTQQDV